MDKSDDGSFILSVDTNTHSGSSLPSCPSADSSTSYDVQRERLADDGDDDYDGLDWTKYPGYARALIPRDSSRHGRGNMATEFSTLNLRLSTGSASRVSGRRPTIPLYTQALAVPTPKSAT